MQKILADVTGTVWKVEVDLNQSVAAGDTLFIVESMKMEIPVLTEFGGTVIEVAAAVGDVVQDGDVLVVVQH